MLKTIKWIFTKLIPNHPSWGQKVKCIVDMLKEQFTDGGTEYSMSCVELRV